jgi:prepilin-type N-terminal cleavage/methylation domain-containing protein
MKNLGQQIKNLQKNQKGFTLIELLIVIVIIAALAVTVFVALNPVKRIKDAHDSRRAADVETQLTSIHEYIDDNSGSLPPAITAGQPGTNGNLTAANLVTGYIIGTCVAGCNVPGAGYTPIAPAAFACGAAQATNAISSATLGTNLASYLKTLPQDPLYQAAWGENGYMIQVSASNIITVTACYPEDNSTGISQSR